jgi:hypothetical protein
MARSYRIVCCLAGLFLLAGGTPLLGEGPQEKKLEARKAAPGKFLRLQRDAKGQPTSLETAIVRYKPASGEGDLVVDLVGVVHIADRGYYRKLNDKLDQYDVVLYELVAPPGTRIPKGGKREGGNPLAMIQGMMKNVLELDSQLEHIDYTRKHFVHADLSPEEMAEAIRKRGDNALTLFMSVAADMLRQQNLQEQKREAAPPKDEEPEIDPLALLLDPDRAGKLKRMMAQQFEELESPEGGFGNTINTILVADRNKAALKVFQTEMAKGKKKIAIFYGAAHMPDFEKRLKEEFGLKRTGEEWLTAWDLKPKKKNLGDLLERFLK